MQQHLKAEEDRGANGFGEFAAELVGGLAEYFIVPILFFLLIAGLVFHCLYVCRLIFGRTNTPPAPTIKHPRPIASPDDGPCAIEEQEFKSIPPTAETSQVGQVCQCRSKLLHFDARARKSCARPI